MDLKGITGDCGNKFDYLIHRHTRATSHIVHAAGDSSGGRSRSGRDDIVYEGKVAGLLSVPVKVNGPALNGGHKESMECHIRTLAGTVNGEVTESHGGDIMIVVIEHAKLFCSKFGHSIRRDWSR